MPYGTIKVDTVTFTDAGVDKSVSISGLVQNPTFSGNITVTGTISGGVVRGGTVSGATVTGTAGQFTTATITSGVFASGTAAAPSIAFAGDLDTGLFTGAANTVGIAANGSAVLTVSGTNVGIGTNSPNAVLDLTATAGAGGQTSVIRFGLGITAESWIGVANSAGNIIANSTLGDTVIRNDGGKILLSTDSGTTAHAVIDSSGRLGIGVSSPQSQLQVLDQVRISNSSQSQGSIVLGDGGSTLFNVGIARWNGGSNTAGAGGIGYFAQGTTNVGGHYFYTGDAVAGSQTEKLRITSAGNVGIGTSSPDGRLEINDQSNGVETFPLWVSNQGAGVGTRATIRFDVANSYYGSIGGGEEIGIGSSVVIDAPGTGGVIRFTKNNKATEIARFDSFGSLGIGTTPATALHVSSADTELRVQSTTSTNGFVRFVNTSGSMSIGMSGAATNTLLTYDRTNNQNVHEYFGGASGYHIWYQNGSEAARIDSSRRLLVGTSTARSNIYVGSTASTPFAQVNTATNNYDNGLALINYTASGYAPWLSIGSSGSNTLGTNTATPGGYQIGGINFVGNDGTNFRSAAFIAAENDQAGAWASGDCPGRLVFSTTADGASSPTEAMRIDNQRNILAGGATDANVGSGTGIKILSSARMQLGAADTTDSSIGYSMYSTGAAAYRFYVGFGGTIYATSTTISAISDRRLKENIKDLDVGLNAILALKPRRFDWKEGFGNTGKSVRGFIAQEVEEVFPDLIDEWEKGENHPEGEEPYKSVRQDLIPVLVKAIQEQQVMIAELQAEVATLKAS
jgi:hypothetical protein